MYIFTFIENECFPFFQCSIMSQFDFFIENCTILDAFFQRLIIFLWSRETFFLFLHHMIESHLKPNIQKFRNMISIFLFKTKIFTFMGQMTKFFQFELFVHFPEFCEILQNSNGFVQFCNKCNFWASGSIFQKTGYFKIDMTKM